MTILAVDAERIWLMDGTDGSLRWENVRRLHERGIWTGYILERSTLARDRRFVQPAFGLSVLAVSLLVAVWMLVRRSKLAPGISVTRCGRIFWLASVLSGMTTFVAVPGNAAANEQVAKIGNAVGVWRIPEHDGVNSLYVMLRSWGATVDYAEIWSRLQRPQRRNSLLELRDAANAMGFSLNLVRVSPHELPTTNLPAIIHLTNFRRGTSTFAVLLAARAQDCYLIEGATATIGRMSAEEFRRSWSGHVLVHSGGGTGIVVNLSSAGAGAVVSLLMAACWLRRRRPRNVSQA